MHTGTSTQWPAGCVGAGRVHPAGFRSNNVDSKGVLSPMSVQFPWTRHSLQVGVNAPTFCRRRDHGTPAAASAGSSLVSLHGLDGLGKNPAPHFSCILS